jgi:hypothetical protein
VLGKRLKIGVRFVKGRWLDLNAKNLIDVRGYLENLQDIKKTDLFHGSPVVQVQNRHLIFFLRPRTQEHQEVATAALVAMGAGAPGIEGLD